MVDFGCGFDAGANIFNYDSCVCNDIDLHMASILLSKFI